MSHFDMTAPDTTATAEQESDAVRESSVEVDFVGSLQGVASFCESAQRSGGMPPDDLGIVIGKLRDAAFVVNALQQLRDELRSELELAHRATAPSHDDDVERVATAINQARYKTDGLKPLAKEDESSKEYAFRLARAALAAMPDRSQEIAAAERRGVERAIQTVREREKELEAARDRTRSETHRHDCFVRSHEADMIATAICAAAAKLPPGDADEWQPIETVPPEEDVWVAYQAGDVAPTVAVGRRNLGAWTIRRGRFGQRPFAWRPMTKPVAPRPPAPEASR